MIRSRIVSIACLSALLGGCGGQATSPPPQDRAAKATAMPNEVISLSGRPLLPPSPIPDQEKLETELAAARAAFESAPDDPDALIWVARRLGYLWRYREAVALLGEGIARWPDNPKLYRHRGHRRITLRDFPGAEADLERAAMLMAGRPNEIEPDGRPNAAGIPRTSLLYNIHYHLGLARYLQDDDDAALAAFADARAVADNDDEVVAVTDWTWMALMRAGAREEAAGLLQAIRPDMELLENDSYHRRLLMYKGVLAPGSLFNPEHADPTDLATQGYGVGNYYLVHGDPARAKAVFEQILTGTGWNTFGYIAAEADLQRMD